MPRVIGVSRGAEGTTAGSAPWRKEEPRSAKIANPLPSRTEGDIGARRRKRDVAQACVCADPPPPHALSTARDAVAVALPARQTDIGQGQRGRCSFSRPMRSSSSSTILSRTPRGTASNV